jgi:hypothetical protein
MKDEPIIRDVTDLPVGDAGVTVRVFSERDVFIIGYGFGSMKHALDFLSIYVPPEGCYTEVES